MLYVHRHYDSVNAITRLHFSASGRWNYMAYNKQTKTFFNLAITQVGQIPHTYKIFDEPTKTWIIEDCKELAATMRFFELSSALYRIVNYTLESDWNDFVVNSNGQPKPKVPQSADAFFNNFETIIETVDKSQAERDTLVQLTGVASWSEIDALDAANAKRLYRQTALRLHPDRNAGDGSQMSTFNALWRIYVTR